jgi:hypothetical protein
MLIAAIASFAFAADATAEVKTLTGEIVDSGCYMGHGGKGADHKSCAQKCLDNGMPASLLLPDGTLYLLTPSHDDADPYNQARKMAAATVAVTGHVMDKGGMKAIEVDKVAAVQGK